MPDGCDNGSSRIKEMSVRNNKGCCTVSGFNSVSSTDSRADPTPIMISEWVSTAIIESVATVEVESSSNTCSKPGICRPGGD